MKQKTLGICMKSVIIAAAVTGSIFFFGIIPSIGKNIACAVFPSLAQAYLPWLIFIFISAAPCYAVLVLSWKISCEIGKDNAFCMKNAKRLKVIGILAIADSVFFLAGNIVYLAIHISELSVFVLALILTVMGIGIAVSAFALSQLIANAAELKEESDFTI